MYRDSDRARCYLDGHPVDFVWHCGPRYFVTTIRAGT
jgi:hypothetical protein